MLYATPYGYSTKQYTPSYGYTRKTERRPYARQNAKREVVAAIRDYQSN